jgi:DNA helicase-2/ATP-dependent DNA helicase PcrA
MPNYLDELNEPQREAVTHKDGPLMIIAGAGSGKTKVLTSRIAHLMGVHEVDAFNILALTFTNKAAREMKERVERTLGNGEARNLYIGTFHSVFARLLRGEAARLGFPANFTIYDTDDAKSVVKAVINEMGLDDKHYKPNTVYNRISAAKNSLIGPEEYQNEWALQQEDSRAGRPAIGKIYDAYNKRCFKNGAMDFDDLLFNMYLLLKKHPEALSKFQRKFRYIMIDEYQDTNTAQYEIVKLLGAMHENVCVVGDDAQSIYSFRGATIENILRFEKDYDDVKVVKLEQNYRSTKTILHVANAVIENNKHQLPKKLWTDKHEGDKIKLVATPTDNEEGRFVSDTIQEERLRNHYQNTDFVILYRTNAQSRSFEESLRRMNIPYKIYGGLSFYQRKEIKDFIAYLRVIVNPSDEEALKRIVNYPVRGIGKTSLDKAQLIANEQNITLWKVLENASRYDFKANAKECIQEFVTLIKLFQSELLRKNAYDLAFLVGKGSGLVRELFNDKTTEGLARYENVQELLNSIKEFVDDPVRTGIVSEDGEVIDDVMAGIGPARDLFSETETPAPDNAVTGASLGAYLQQITLLTDADNEKDEINSVKLMTIHAAKGLEFNCVFVVGLEESLFPNAMSINTREELEEERRLFYVAVTRARKKLWLTHAAARYRFGQLQQNDPSRFIEEIPDDYLDRTNARGTRSAASDSSFRNNPFAANRPGSFSRKEEKSKPAYLVPVRPQVKEHIPSENFAPSDTSNLQAGQKVEHQKFGYGVVGKIEGGAHNPIATVLFELNGEKKIMLNYARLRIVEA